MKKSLSLLKTVFVCLSTLVLTRAGGPMTPTRFIEVNGVNLAVYESAGDRGPGILLIHGNTGSANIFADLMRSSFAGEYHVVAVDLPGYGQSENAPYYSTATFDRAIVEVAQATCTDKGVILGWSMGGDLALQASPQLPNVQGYFLIGTAPLGYAPELPPPYLTPQESYAGPAVNYGFIPFLNPAQINNFVHAWFRPDYNGIPACIFNDAQRADPGTRLAVYLAAIGQDPSFLDEVAIVRNLDVPVAWVVGDQDFLIRPEYLEGLAGTVPRLWMDGPIIIKNSGHAVQFERANKVISLLKKFLKDL